MGTHIWPGEYHTILTMIGEEESEELKGEIKKTAAKIYR
jgi:hypothetical protein